MNAIYKNLPINQILQGDCLELFKNIPDNSIDHVFADLPFNLGKKYNSYKDVLLESEYILWCKEWIRECVRVLKMMDLFFFIIFLNGLLFTLLFLMR